MDNHRISKNQLLASLPPEWPQDPQLAIQKQIRADGRKIVVIDDDPTGTQTVHGVPVLTDWSAAALAAEFQNDLPAFYILTNSRSVSLPAARKINTEIGHNLNSVAAKTNHGFVVISRSDSTLRGHFPGEVEALSAALNQPFDGWIINPFFLEGGRYTINDVHYVQEGDMLVPAAKTEFARDRVFGYSSSNLRDWVSEKTGGQIAARDVTCISIADLRSGGPEAVTAVLMSMHNGQCCVVDAAGYRDIEVFVQGLLVAEARDKRFLFRTAASFVRVRAGLSLRPLLRPAELNLTPDSGGLIVVGSYVTRSTQQVNALLSSAGVSKSEISVSALLDNQLRDKEMDRVAKKSEQALKRGNDMLIFTGRRLVTGKDSKSNLHIGKKVSQGIIDILQRIQTVPRYILAKGGITSNDIATRALNVKRAMVLGQIMPGVPVWQLGPESRFAGMTYAVFPGNVGDADALLRVVQQLKAES